MISKRNKRFSQPQETLRQFSLNNSKGIDESKSITDNSTILYSENLKINPDGSLSLRDPIEETFSTSCNTRDINVYPTKAFPIFDGKYYFIVANDGSAGVCDTDGNYIPFQVKWTSYDGIENSLNVEAHATALKSMFDFTNVELISTRTSVTLGNCKVLVAALHNLVDVSLYDSGISELYRYVQLYEKDDSVVLEIKTPEVNRLTTSEGELALPINTTLDNPYAVSDTYLASYVDIKGIIPYVYTSDTLDIVDASDAPERVTVKELTESVKDVRFRPVSSIDVKHLETFNGAAYIKAVGTFPNKRATEHPVTWQIDDESVCSIQARDTSVRVSPKKVGKAVLSASYGELSKSCNITVEHCYVRMEVYGTRYIEPNATEYVAVKLFTSTGATPEPTGNLSVTHFGDGGFKYNIVDFHIGEDQYDIEVTAPSRAGLKTTLKFTYTHLSGVSLTASIELVTEYSVPLSINPPAVSEGVTNSRTLSKPSSGSILRLSSSELHFYIEDGGSTEVDAYVVDVMSNVYGAWSKLRQDGTYEPVDPGALTAISVRERSESATTSSDINTDTSDTWITVKYALLSDIVSSNEYVTDRIDVYPATKDSLKDSMRFKVIVPKVITEDSPEYDNDAGGDQMGVGLVLDVAEYTPNLVQEWEFANYDNGNSSRGKKLLYKNSIYSYGDTSFKNTVFKSDAGSLITPYLNGIDAESIGISKISAIVPWRDYLYIATENAAILAIPSEAGFYTKIVNTFVGIPSNDSECCKATLNGIIFKSGSKVFMGYPNLYSEGDTVLNYTEISRPIESVLDDIRYDSCYAITTASEYRLMLLSKDSTYSLNYEYVTKVWSVYKYPVKLENAYVYNDGSVHAFYTYPDERRIVEVTLNGRASDDGTYQDVLYEGNVSIPFMLDTGQKTDSIMSNHQFVESKLMFATLSERDSFPFTTYIAIDGDPHVVTTDVSTDAPFWKSDSSRGVAGTIFRLGGADAPGAGAFNTLRQLVLRYSGKGKSIRHVIEGQSRCNFKLYETYVRYKNLSGK